MQLADVRGAYYPVSSLIAHRIVAKENLPWAIALQETPMARAASTLSAITRRRI